MSIPAPDEISMEDPLSNSSFGSMVSLDYVNPVTGNEPKDMEFTDANEQNFATSSDIYSQNVLDDTASFSNVLDVDDDEVAEFFAVVVDRTGQPVETSKSDYLQKDYGFSWSSQVWKSGDGEHHRPGQPGKNSWDSLGKVDPHR